MPDLALTPMLLALPSQATADGGLLALLGVAAALAWHHLARLRPDRTGRSAS